MTVVRRALGYRRYVFSVQYHGSSFLGFSWQENQENVILPDGTDLRGYRSVEGRLRQALQSLFPSLAACIEGNSGFENIQVSSRTDRGVHALKNTLHVDLWNQHDNLTTQQIHRGVNFFLSRQRELQNNNDNNDNDENMDPKAPKPQRRLRGANQVVMGGDWVRHDPMNELRVLNVKEAPLYMDNPGAAAANESRSSLHNHSHQSAVVDWNARFSATQRTYMYRILHTHDPTMHNNNNNNNNNNNMKDNDENDTINSYNSDQQNNSSDHTDWAAPFEWDRSWRIMDGSDGGGSGPLDINSMLAAAAHLQGTHDFSSFQASGCQRKSPVTTIHKIDIHSQPYGLLPLSWERNNNSNGGGGGLLGLGSSSASSCQLVTILFSGNSFLYHQVRNMVSCLVKVGRGRLKPEDVKSVLAARNRSRVPGTAPAHGLYLVDVQHGDFSI